MKSFAVFLLSSGVATPHYVYGPANAARALCTRTTHVIYTLYIVLYTLITHHRHAMMLAMSHIILSDDGNRRKIIIFVFAWTRETAAFRVSIQYENPKNSLYCAE